MSVSVIVTSLKKVGIISINTKQQAVITTNKVPVKALNGLQSLNNNARPVKVTTMVIIVVRVLEKSSEPLVIQTNV